MCCCANRKGFLSTTILFVRSLLCHAYKYVDSPRVCVSVCVCVFVRVCVSVCVCIAKLISKFNYKMFQYIYFLDLQSLFLFAFQVDLLLLVFYAYLVICLIFCFMFPYGCLLSYCSIVFASLENASSSFCFFFFF